MRIIVLTLLFFATSCALFKASPSLENRQPEELLKAVRILGEGKGRLSLGDNQYVFGVDSVLKDTDWILAVSIPLHGEEVMILKNLEKKVVQDVESESFEKRIRWEFKQRKLDKVVSPGTFLTELRLLIRLILSQELKLDRRCNAHKGEYSCILDGEIYKITVTDKKFFLHKDLGSGNLLELVAQNLTDSFFSKTDFHLYTNESKLSKKPSFSMELFW